MFHPLLKVSTTSQRCWGIDSADFLQKELKFSCTNQSSGSWSAAQVTAKGLLEEFAAAWQRKTAGGLRSVWRGERRSVGRQHSSTAAFFSPSQTPISPQLLTRWGLLSKTRRGQPAAKGGGLWGIGGKGSEKERKEAKRKSCIDVSTPESQAMLSHTYGNRPRATSQACGGMGVHQIHIHMVWIMSGPQPVGHDPKMPRRSVWKGSQKVKRCSMQIMQKI